MAARYPQTAVQISRRRNLLGSGLASLAAVVAALGGLGVACGVAVAVPAAGGAYRAWQHDIASREDKRERERAEAEIAATRIASTTLTMGVKVGEGGKLFGSITAKDIADALARRGIEVDRHKIDLEEPLKSLGTYKVAVKVSSGLAPEVTVVVEPKG